MLDDCKILLVEDEAYVALDLSLTLQDKGADVSGPFANVAAALPACRAPLDAALLDVDLLSGTTFPVADRLLEDGVPFVFHTGSSDHSKLQDRYGPDVPILSKPARSEDLVRALRSVIDD